MTAEQIELGEFEPDQAETIRLKHLAQINPSKSEVSGLPSDTKVSFVPLDGIGTTGAIEYSETKTLDEVYDGYTYFREGDIVIAKITPSFENGKGALCKGLENGIGFGTTELHVLRPQEGTHSKYLWYVLRSKSFMDGAEASMRSVAGQQRVPSEFVENYRVREIPFDAQQKVAKFLDQHTGRIDVLIEKKNTFLELLEEKRKAEITRLVTAGLNPDVKTKETESKWFGKIPAHWKLSRLNYLRDTYNPIVYGIILPGPDQDEGVPIIKGGDCEEGELDPEKLSKTTEEKAAEYQRSRLQAGDLVYEIRGSVGRVVKVPPELEGANLTQDTARIVPRDGINADWLLYALRSEPFHQQMELHTRGATVQGVNLEDLRRGVLPVPPIEEQKQIAQHINEVDERIHNLRGQVKTGVNLLREKRQALITAAVSGQLDLSDWQLQKKEVEK